MEKRNNTKLTIKRHYESGKESVFEFNIENLRLVIISLSFHFPSTIYHQINFTLIEFPLSVCVSVCSAIHK